MLTTPKIAKSVSKSVDGSGTGDRLPIAAKFPAGRAVRSVPAPLLKLAELMPPAPKGPLNKSEPATANPLGKR